MDEPLVSIMMPARNVGPVIRATVQSIRAQTYTHWELIFVDDGSTDDTLAVMQELARADARIKVFPMAHGGRGRARNACVERASGEFIAVCDADDLSFPERFRKQVCFLRERLDVGAVGSWWIPFSGDVPPADGPVRQFPTDPDQLRRAFARGKMRFHNATVMIRRELFSRHGAYNVELRRAQDYEFFSRLSRKGVRFAALPEPLLYYRQEAAIPSAAYFHENGMFMAYADQLLAGKGMTFDAFASSGAGRFWSVYYRLKYLYFYTKLMVLGRLGR